MTAAKRFELEHDLARLRLMQAAVIACDASRCVQCGICNFSCPIGLDVRAHAWLGEDVIDRHCLTCGQCVLRCPRGVLSFADRRAVPFERS